MVYFERQIFLICNRSPRLIWLTLNLRNDSTFHHSEHNPLGGVLMVAGFSVNRSSLYARQTDLETITISTDAIIFRRGSQTQLYEEVPANCLSDLCPWIGVFCCLCTIWMGCGFGRITDHYKAITHLCVCILKVF